MKLRISGDSLRLRLSQAELARLADGGAVTETVHFGPEPGARLSYELLAVEGAPELDAELDDHTIRVRVSAAAVRTLATTEAVGLSVAQPIGADRTLTILVEKDFRCLVPRPGEDMTDAFPRPDDAPSC